MSGNDAKFLRDQAEHCRWLAKQSSEMKTITTLTNMARDYEAQADAIEASDANQGQ
jgi:hypothetical protein